MQSLKICSTNVTAKSKVNVGNNLCQAKRLPVMKSSQNPNIPSLCHHSAFKFQLDHHHYYEKCQIELCSKWPYIPIQADRYIRLWKRITTTTKKKTEASLQIDAFTQWNYGHNHSFIQSVSPSARQAATNPMAFNSQSPKKNKNKRLMMETLCMTSFFFLFFFIFFSTTKLLLNNKWNRNRFSHSMIKLSKSSREMLWNTFSRGKMDNLSRWHCFHFVSATNPNYYRPAMRENKLSEQTTVYIPNIIL